MVAFIRTFFAVILAILTLVFVPLFLVMVVAVFSDTGPRDGSWLTVGLEGELLEHYGPPTLRGLLDDPPPCLMEITENLEKAAVDDRIEGVLFRIGFFGASQGKLDEIRGGIRRVQQAGKPVYAYGSFLTDGGFYLASECDSLFLFPKGKLHFLGRGAAIQHLKGSLEKLDVKDQFHATGDYKSAVELFTTERSSEKTLENIRWILEDLAESFDATLAENLSREPGDLDALRERAIIPAADALAEGLVDDVVWFDELTDRLRGTNRTWRTISSQDYAQVDRGSVGLGGKTKVAVVHAQGFIASGGDDRWDGAMGLTMGPDRVIADLKTAWEDDAVKAILLRWDTNGGATDGSQRIMRAVARARDEKPVVVSIADHAASGGYMMSFPANWIVCAPNGITGSIGSIVGKFNTRGLFEKLGVTFDEIALSPHAFLYSGIHDWTEAQWERIGEDNWRTYNDWVQDIADERGLSFDEVDGVARGRVWTGRQAAERNLVDALGGFHKALAEVRRLADLDDDQKVTLVHYPAPRTVFDLLVSGDIGYAASTDLAREIHRAWKPRSELPGAFSYEPFRAR